MNLPEMGTMCQWDIPVKMVVFKNNRLGMVHEHQFMLYNSNYQAVYLDGSPDFNKLADAYGIKNSYIKENSQIDGAIDEMMKDNESYLLVLEVDPYETTGDSLNEKPMTVKEDN